MPPSRPNCSDSALPAEPRPHKWVDAKGVEGCAPTAPLRSEEPLIFRYANYKGETSERHVLPIRLYFGSTKYYPREQWLLEAFDLDKKENRTFAFAALASCSSSEPEQEGNNAKCYCGALLECCNFHENGVLIRRHNFCPNCDSPEVRAGGEQEEK